MNDLSSEFGEQTNMDVSSRIRWIAIAPVPVPADWYAVPLRPALVILTGSLAVAAITAVALTLFRGLDATAMILMWSVGTAGPFVGLGGSFGGATFSWVAPRLDPRTA
jgi:hypothetical protein